MAAMTINKAQGQTLGRVGVYLDSPCFSHGQLYVAASRVGHPNNIKFAIMPDASYHFYTPNIVYTEALTAAPSSARSASTWGDFDVDSGEHFTPNNEHGRCCSPLTCVPEEVYVTLSEAEIIEDGIVCEGCEWVPYEIAKERLRLEFAPQFGEQIMERLSPLAVVMQAPDYTYHNLNG